MDNFNFLSTEIKKKYYFGIFKHFLKIIFINCREEGRGKEK